MKKKHKKSKNGIIQIIVAIITGIFLLAAAIIPPIYGNRTREEADFSMAQNSNASEYYKTEGDNSPIFNIVTEEKEDSNEENSVELISSNIKSLFEVSTYVNDSDSEVDINGLTYYTRGCLATLNILNDTQKPKAIEECNFYIDSIKQPDIKLIDILYHETEDEIKFYVFNIGSDVINADIKLVATNSYDVSSYESLESNLWEKSIIFDLSHNEAKEIFNIDKSELIEMEDNSQFMIYAFGDALKNEGCYICCIMKRNGEILIFQYEGGYESEEILIPVFVKIDDKGLEVKNIHFNFPTVKEVQNLVFVVLPDKTCNIDFRIELMFNDKKIIAENYSANIIVPLFNDVFYHDVINIMISNHWTSYKINIDGLFDANFIYNPQSYFTRMDFRLKNGYIPARERFGFVE